MTDSAPADSPARLTPLTVFAVSVMAVAFGAALLAVAIYAQLKEEVATPRENLQWAVYQLQAEHLRLMLASREAAVGRLDVEAIDQRYQIFVSRVLILRDGEVFRPIRGVAGYDEAIGGMVSAIAAIDEAVQDASAAEYAETVSNHLGAFGAPLQTFALEVVGAASRQQTDDQHGLLDTVSYLAITLMLVVAASVVLAGVTMQQLTELEAGRRALAAALRIAEDSNLAKSRFLAGMSHEMRTPLNAVLGMLREVAHRTTDRRTLDMVATAHASADMLCGLVDDVLDTTRIATGKFRFHSTAFDPATLMTEVASLLASRASDQDTRLILDTQALGPSFVVSDRGRLRQVLINLVGNAVKFTQGGTVTLKAWTSPAADDLIMLRVAVTDTGIGIAGDQLGRIFTRFAQAESGDGLGLGLTISREIVERLGGRIGVESEIGRGSTFWFEVPVLTSAAPVPVPADQPLRDRLRGLRILVAEDSSINRRVIELLLERQGATYAFAVNGEEAVAMTLATTYDLVLMDINMPVMDGLQALAALRRSARADLPPVIALTATALADDLARFLTAGMAACVTKPIDEVDLLRRIAETLRRPDIAADTAADTVHAAGPTAALSGGQRRAVLDLISTLDDDQDRLG